MRRITVDLTEEEQRALAELATLEKRPARLQAALELRHALERRGLLAKATPRPGQPQAAEVKQHG